MTNAETATSHPLSAQLSEILPLAARAANAHNTQPWELRYHEDHIEIGWRTEWALGPSDPTHRDLRLSLGTYVETLLICASEAGTPLRFEPDYDARSTRVGLLRPVREPYPHSARVEDVRKRRVWRGAWTAEQLPPEAVAAAQEAVREAGFRLAVISTDQARPLLIRAYHWFFGHAGIAAELLAWARLSPRHPDYRKDGLNDVMLVLNKAERVAMRWFFAPPVYRLLRPIGLVRLLTTLSSSATSGTGQVMVIMGKGNDPMSEVAAGRVLTRVWLEFFRQGIYAHPQSHIIDCPYTSGELAAECGAEDGERPLVFFRAGYPVNDPALRPEHPRRETAVRTGK